MIPAQRQSCCERHVAWLILLSAAFLLSGARALEEDHPGFRLPFVPEDFLDSPSSSFSEAAPAMRDVRPQDICLVTDHEPIPPGTCDLLFRDLGKTPDDVATVEDFEKSGKGFLWDRWSSQYNQVIPCLNREYACRHGYSFIMPSSPSLTILQPPATTEELQAVANAEAACARLDATVSKVEHGVADTSSRSQTWCKVAVLGMLARDLAGRCRALVFLDADLLLLPDDNRTYAYEAESLEARVAASPGASRGAVFRRMVRDDWALRVARGGLMAKSHNNAPWSDARLFEKLMELEPATHALGGSVSVSSSSHRRHQQGRRPPLHLQDEVREFLASPGLSMLTNRAVGSVRGSNRTTGGPMAGWPMAQRRPKRSFGSSSKTKEGRVNSIMSSSFMVLKNTPRLRLMLYDWWHAVDHRLVALDPVKKTSTAALVGTSVENTRRCSLGKRLESYRTRWPHEQRVFDDFLDHKYRGELLVVRKSNTYNTATGTLAQHYFYKDAHRWNYMSVLHEHLAKRDRTKEHQDSLCKMSRGVLI